MSFRGRTQAAPPNVQSHHYANTSNIHPVPPPSKEGLALVNTKYQKITELAPLSVSPTAPPQPTSVHAPSSSTHHVASSLTPTPSTPATPSARDRASFDGHHRHAPNVPFTLMTERQQLAYLLRTTSENEKEKEEADANEGQMESEDENDSDAGVNGSDAEDGSDMDDESDGSDEEEAASSAPVRYLSSSPPSSSARLSSALPVHDHLPRVIRRPLEYQLWCADKQKKWDAIQKNPNAFYYHYLPPGVRPRAGSSAEGPPSPSSVSLPWTEQEKILFLYSLECYPPEGQWGLFSINIPGRTGWECEQFCKQLIKEGLIEQEQPVKMANGGKRSRLQQKPMPLLLSSTIQKQYRFESTPYVVKRNAASSNGSPDVCVSGAPGPEMETAIAILSLAPTPGTENLKPTPGAGLIDVKTAALLNARMQRESSHSPSTPVRGRRKQHTATALTTDDDTPIRPNIHIRHRDSKVTSLRSGGLREAPSPSQHSTNSAGKKVHAHEERGNERRRARAVAQDIAGKVGDDDNDNDDSMGSLPLSSPVVAHIGGKRKQSQPQTDDDLIPSSGNDEARAPRKRPALDHAANATRNTGGSQMPPQSVHSPLPLGSKKASTAIEPLQFTPVFPAHAIPTQVVSASSSQSSTAVAAVSDNVVSHPLPFSSFTIPAHTPFVSEKRLKALTAPPHTERAVRPATPVQALPYPRPYFDDPTPTLEPSIDVKGEVRMTNAENGQQVYPPLIGSASTHHASDSDNDDDDDSFALELSKLESTYRCRVKKLAAHQAAQIERIKKLYGFKENEPDQLNMQRTATLNAAASTHERGPFGQTKRTFTNGCRRMLAEYFNKEVEAESATSIIHRCRTYGEALSEIAATYRSLLKELQREHATGRDVLNSLKAAGILK